MIFRGSIVMVLLAGLAGACAVVPVRTTPGPPPTWNYLDPHGRPRAFGGGVCPLQGRHTHGWPPAPAVSFVDDDGAWRDTRRMAPFAGPHRLGTRRCAIPALHHHAIAGE